MSRRVIERTSKAFGSKLDGALTVDLEDWRCALNPDKNADYRQRPTPSIGYLRDSTSALLEELDRVDAKATFFVLGEVARVVPDVVKDVARRGHEIASHSPVHLPPSMIPRETYERMVRDDVGLIADLVGYKPVGFRVPYLKIGRSDGWIIEMLARLGFQYDSSIAPTWTPYWGIPSAPKHPYYPDLSDISKETDNGLVVEIPLTVWPSWSLLPGLPVAGGFYMRAWPTPALLWMLRRNVRSGIPVNLYVHPGNLDLEKEMVSNPSFRDRISQYSGYTRGVSVFREIISKFRFGSIREVFRDHIRS